MTDLIELAKQQAVEIDALRTRLEDTVRDSTNEIEALRADVEAWNASHSMLTDTCHHFQARAERLAEALRLIESAKDRGFGIDYARHVAQRALRDHDQEVDNG